MVDASGQTLLPGYVALHEHTYFGDVGQATEMSRTGPALLLGYGVTTAMTAGSQLPYRELSTKREVDADRRPGPRFHISGPYIDQLWRLPFARNVTDGNEVRRVVRYWASEGVTWFKFMGRVTTDVLRAGIEEAHALGFRVGGHLCAVTFTEAAALGIDVLHHGFLMNTDYAPEKQVDECPQGYFRTYETLDLTVPPTSDSIVRLAQSGVAVVSTLAAYETFAPTRYRLPERVLVMLEPTTATLRPSCVSSARNTPHPASTEALEDAVPGRGLAHGRCLLTEPPSTRDRAEPHAETNPRMTPPVGISKWTG